MRALVLLSELRQRGVRFVADGDTLRVIHPKGKPLPESVKNLIRAHKEEICHRLRTGGCTAEDLGEVFPGSVDVTSAVRWLTERLTQPQRIAEVIAEWVGTVDRPAGRDVDTLMQVRWALGVEAYIGTDNRAWWKVPPRTVH